MSNLEQIINISKDLESALETKFGAIGKGLHEKISSVEHILNEELIRKVRFIATIRNKAVHESGYSVNDRDMERVELYYADIVEGGVENNEQIEAQMELELDSINKEIMILEEVKNQMKTKREELEARRKKYRGFVGTIRGFFHFISFGFLYDDYLSTAGYVKETIANTLSLSVKYHDSLKTDEPYSHTDDCLPPYDMVTGAPVVNHSYD